MGKFQQFQQQFADMQAPTCCPKPSPSGQPQGLTPADRQQLALLASQPAFAILDKLLEFEAERFTSMLLQAEPTNRDAVLAAHTRAQVAWEIVSHLRRQISFECGEAQAEAEQPPVTGDIIEDLEVPTSLF